MQLETRRLRFESECLTPEPLLEIHKVFIKILRHMSWKGGLGEGGGKPPLPS